MYGGGGRGEERVQYDLKARSHLPSVLGFYSLDL